MHVFLERCLHAHMPFRGDIMSSNKYSFDIIRYALDILDRSALGYFFH